MFRKSKLRKTDDKLLSGVKYAGKPASRRDLMDFDDDEVDDDEDEDDDEEDDEDDEDIDEEDDDEEDDEDEEEEQVRKKPSSSKPKAAAQSRSRFAAPSDSDDDDVDASDEESISRQVGSSLSARSVTTEIAKMQEEDRAYASCSAHVAAHLTLVLAALPTCMSRRPAPTPTRVFM